MFRWVAHAVKVKVVGVRRVRPVQLVFIFATFANHANNANELVSHCNMTGETALLMNQIITNFEMKNNQSIKN